MLEQFAKFHLGRLDNVWRLHSAAIRQKNHSRNTYESYKKYMFSSACYNFRFYRFICSLLYKSLNYYSSFIILYNSDLRPSGSLGLNSLKKSEAMRALACTIWTYGLSNNRTAYKTCHSDLLQSLTITITIISMSCVSLTTETKEPCGFSVKCYSPNDYQQISQIKMTPVPMSIILHVDYTQTACLKLFAGSETKKTQN